MIDSADNACVFLNTEQLTSRAIEANPWSLPPAEAMDLLEGARDSTDTEYQSLMVELAMIQYAITKDPIGLANSRLEQFRRRFEQSQTLHEGRGMNFARVTRAYSAFRAKLTAQR